MVSFVSLLFSLVPQFLTLLGFKPLEPAIQHVIEVTVLI